MKKKSFWISYDLGLRGDYAGLYTWLDTLKAKECGDSVAYFTKTFANQDVEEIIQKIKEELFSNVKINTQTDRAYLIYYDNTTNKVKGTFLAGGRKRAPWEGYALSSLTGNEDFIIDE